MALTMESQEARIVSLKEIIISSSALIRLRKVQVIIFLLFVGSWKLMIRYH